MGQDICLWQHCLLRTLGQWSPTDTVFWTVLTFPHDCTQAVFLMWVPHGRCWCESQVWVRLSPCRHEDWVLLAEMSPLSGDEEGTLLRVTLLPPWRLTCGLSIQGCSSQNRSGVYRIMILILLRFCYSLYEEWKWVLFFPSFPSHFVLLFLYHSELIGNLFSNFIMGKFHEYTEAEGIV